MLRFSQISSLTGLKRHALNARTKNLFKNEDLLRSPGNQILLTPEQVKHLINDQICELKGKIIYIGNLKGGVGKTTIAYLLINALSILGLKTCAIDLDVQTNLTRQFMEVNVNHPVFIDVIDNKINIKLRVMMNIKTMGFFDFHDHICRMDEHLGRNTAAV